MRRFLRRVAYPGAALAPLFLLAACSSLHPRTADSECGQLVPDCGPAKVGCQPIQVCNNPTVLTLAHDLDHLERHIEWYGSVTAKVPDVWGQARLTQYRDEFEKTMAKDIEGFAYNLQGTLSRSDTAYFASATALSFAAQPKPPVVGSSSSTKGNAPSLVPTDATLVGVHRTATGVGASVTQLAPPAAAKSPDPVKPIDLGDPSGLVSSTDTVVGTRNPARLPTALPFGQGAGQVGIEPTELLAQKKRYLDFLAQIRRENEGDDTADSPGYSLNLMRIPVSVLPGKRTDVGFGAEITMTVTPVLGHDLLPMTFRNLIQNDLVNQLGFPLTQVLHGNSYDNFDKLLTEEMRQQIAGVGLLRAWAFAGGTDSGMIRARYNQLSDEDKRRLWVVVKNELVGMEKLPEPGKEHGDPKILDGIEFLLKYLATLLDLERRGQRMGCDNHASPGLVPNAPALQPETQPTQYRLLNGGSGLSMTPFSANANVASGQKDKAIRAWKMPGLSFANGLDNRTAVPTSQLFDVYGDTNLLAIGFGAKEALGQAFNDQKFAHLPDVQSYLREEVRAAQQFLAQPAQLCLWEEFCTPELVNAVRSRQIARLQDLRETFRCRVEAITLTDQYRLSRPQNELMQFSNTAALAWCVIVDSALLTDRLLRDIKETATAKNKPMPPCPLWCPFYLPDPPRECRDLFNGYVGIRWPIHVFALDPYNQEQNIADSLSTRREMQLALAIAFTNGQISARNMTKYVRRLEAEYQTITLNRTQVGFSHGEDVFGWRFYPRFQTPDTESNAKVFARDLMLGGPDKNALLRDSRLEPGERECVAVVMMPSFVPYVTVDTSSNWFPLTSPKGRVRDVTQKVLHTNEKVLDTTAAVKLSRAVHTIQQCAPNVQDPQCYRNGELDRLRRRADQLAARLPTQTLTSSVPILNTYGGFEMFSNGTTDLAPELFGWYGAPGIDPTIDSTTLFLVGDHFSPLRTHVIVGNQAISPGGQTMLSRQVMKVTFGKGAYPVVYEKNEKVVRVHLATPYGVTRELEIPVVKQTPKEDPKPGFSFAADAKLTALYGRACTVNDGMATKNYVPVPQGAEVEDDLKIAWVAPGNTLTPTVEVMFEFTYDKANLKVPCYIGLIGKVTKKEVVIDKAELHRLAIDLVGQIARNAGTLPTDPDPLAKGLTSTKVTIKPIALPDMVVQGVETNNQLKVEFKATGVCPPPPVLQPMPLGKPLPVVTPKEMPKKDEPKKPADDTLPTPKLVEDKLPEPKKSGN